MSTYKMSITFDSKENMNQALYSLLEIHGQEHKMILEVPEGESVALTYAGGIIELTNEN